MATREEIRNKLIDMLDEAEYFFKKDEDDRPRSYADTILDYLHSQGVVIKVDRDLVNTTSETEDIKSELHRAVNAHINNETTFIELMGRIVGTGYVAVKSLIGDEK